MVSVTPRRPCNLDLSVLEKERQTRAANRSRFRSTSKWGRCGMDTPNSGTLAPLPVIPEPFGWIGWRDHKVTLRRKLAQIKAHFRAHLPLDSDVPLSTFTECDTQRLLHYLSEQQYILYDLLNYGPVRCDKYCDWVNALCTDLQHRHSVSTTWASIWAEFDALEDDDAAWT